MKKMLVLAVLLACLLITGCDIEEQKPGISTVKNASTNFDVTYHFKDEIERMITKGSEESFERPLYDYIKLYEPSKRVLLKTEYPHKNDVVYSFNERQSYPIKVKNTIGENAIISADGWMENINLTNESVEQSNPNWLIYTDKPNFTVSTASGFPAEIAYNFLGDTFLLTIKW